MNSAWNRKPFSLSEDNWRVVSKYLATSVHKQRYLKDMKPFTDVFTLKNVALQVTKAALLPLNMVMFEAQKHEMEQNMHPEKKLPDFDWEAAVKKQMKSFQDLTIRYCTVSVLRKSLEELMLLKLSVRLVDKLTKDVFQSLKRKVAKFGHSVACQKIFFTSLHGSVLLNASNFIYDIVHAGIMHLHSWYTSSSSSSTAVAVRTDMIQPLRAAGYLANRVTFYSLMTLASASGYAAGSFVNESYGGFLGSMVVEVLAGVALAGLPTSF